MLSSGDVLARKMIFVIHTFLVVCYTLNSLILVNLPYDESAMPFVCHNRPGVSAGTESVYTRVLSLGLALF